MVQVTCNLTQAERQIFIGKKDGLMPRSTEFVLKTVISYFSDKELYQNDDLSSFASPSHDNIKSLLESIDNKVRKNLNQIEEVF